MSARARRLAGGTALLLAGCWPDSAPEVMRLRIDGPPGEPLELVLSQEFSAQRNRTTGRTRVTLVAADTLVRVAPFDSVISIMPDRNLFAQASPTSADSLLLRVRVDSGVRELYNGTGFVWGGGPWRFVYTYNALLDFSIDLDP